MNSDFALTLGTFHRYATARFLHLFNLSYRGPALIEPRTDFRVIRDFSLSTIISAFLVIALAIPAPSASKKIIFDTDPGTDDAMALMLALNSPELDIRAVTVVPGNVTAEQGLENALRMMSLANRCDIPVAAGAQHPLFQKLITAEFWHGKNGLANVELPPSKCKVDSRYAPDVIIEMVRGGLGVAALAKWAVSPQLDSGALVGLSLTEQGFRRTWSAAQVRDTRTPPYVEEFIRVLAEHPIPECVRPRKVTARKRAAA